ncbi:MAG TPA: GTP-binding protein [Gemmatimonadales bacterium]|nr:GTP-binding protein [Gemmatimonadales bacterium]
MHHPRIPDAPVPVTIVGGYLGAGKTTLVNHLLEQAGGRRVAVIVNDFGQVPYARSQPRNACIEVRLSRGCICCRATTDFIMALTQVRRRRPRPDHVLVEAGSACDLTAVAESARLHGLHVEATVVVADAEAIHAQAVHPRSGRRVLRQLLAADLVVLNKVELLSQPERRSVHDWLAGLIPRARVVEVSYGRVPIPLILDRTPGGTPKEPGRRLAAAEPELVFWNWSRPQAFDAGAFRWWAASLPEGVLRGTGLVHFADDPGRRQRFQLVGSRWSVSRSGPWGAESPNSALTLIGHAGAFDPALLDVRIASCVVEPRAASVPPTGAMSSSSATLELIPSL